MRFFVVNNKKLVGADNLCKLQSVLLNVLKNADCFSVNVGFLLFYEIIFLNNIRVRSSIYSSQKLMEYREHTFSQNTELLIQF